MDRDRYRQGLVLSRADLQPDGDLVREEVAARGVSTLEQSRDEERSVAHHQGGTQSMKKRLTPTRALQGAFVTGISPLAVVPVLPVGVVACQSGRGSSAAAAAPPSATTPSPTSEKPRLVLQVTVDPFRGDLPTRYADRLGEGGLR